MRFGLVLAVRGFYSFNVIGSVACIPLTHFTAERLARCGVRFPPVFLLQYAFLPEYGPHVVLRDRVVWLHSSFPDRRSLVGHGSEVSRLHSMAHT